MYPQLTKLIGKKFLFRGRTWLLVEILRAEDAMVIAPIGIKNKKLIQADQYGHATRRCQECLTVPLTNTDGSGGYSETVMELLSGRIPD